MKIQKVIRIILHPFQEEFKSAERLTSMYYDPNDVTRAEYREFVANLARRRINRTFREPVRFTTEAERAERRRFAAMVRDLAQNNSNKTFIA